MFMYKYLCRLMFSFLMGKYLGMKLLGHMVCVAHRGKPQLFGAIDIRYHGSCLHSGHIPTHPVNRHLDHLPQLLQVPLSSIAPQRATLQ